MATCTLALPWSWAVTRKRTQEGLTCRRRGFGVFFKVQSSPRRRHLVSCVCVCYVAQSQISETEKRKAQRELANKGRKDVISVNAFEEAEQPVSSPLSTEISRSGHVDNGNETEKPKQTVVRRKVRKKSPRVDLVNSDLDSSGTDDESVGPVERSEAENDHKLVEDNKHGTDSYEHWRSIGDTNRRGTFQAITDQELFDNTEIKISQELRFGDESKSRRPLDKIGEGKQALDNLSGEDLVEQENELRLLYMESTMEHARRGNVEGVEGALQEMYIAGIMPGPRAYHGLVAVYTRAGDAEGAVYAMQRAVASVDRPLSETFIALARLFGSLGLASQGDDILACMEDLNYNPRNAWIVLIDELQKSGYMKEANEVFFKGSEGAIRAIPRLYDSLIEKNAMVGDHGNALNIMRNLQYAGFKPTTRHYNCLLMCQANANVPEIAADTFETMHYGPDEMKPDTESYNWLLQAHIRHNEGDRCQEAVFVLGDMVEDHERVQPNMRTYALLVECFVKHNVANEAVRHFRALGQIPGGMQYLHNEGKNGDPLSLYLRSCCLEGRATDLLAALDAMVLDQQPIPRRAMLVNRRGRTLVSSWIEPIAFEADLGYEIDYIARYVAEGGGDETRKRWSDKEAHKEDSRGFSFSAPVEMSFKQYCKQMQKRYTLKLIRKVRTSGVNALGPGATDEDVVKVLAKLRKEIQEDSIYQPRKPKGASKMVVSELKEELEAQGLPTDGTRPVLYQRVQKARRINRARGRPLWIPDIREELEEEAFDERTNAFLGQLNLENEQTEFWRKRLDREGDDVLFPGRNNQVTMVTEDVDSDDRDNGDDGDDGDDGDGETDEIEMEEIEDSEEIEEDGEDETGFFEDEDHEAADFLARKLLKKPKIEVTESVFDIDDGREQWKGLSFEQKVAKVRNEKLLLSSDIYTVADVWGWTWEKEILAKEPQHWSQEWEVKLGMQIFHRVLDLGGAPTIGDCAMLLHAAVRIPWPEAVVSIIQQTHKIHFKFGSKLYNEVVKLFIRVGEKDAAIAVITEMEDVGISAPSHLITTVLMESSTISSQEIK